MLEIRQCCKFGCPRSAIKSIYISGNRVDFCDECYDEHAQDCRDGAEEMLKKSREEQHISRLERIATSLERIADEYTGEK